MYFLSDTAIWGIYYCWWKKSCTTWDVENLGNDGMNYQPQLVSRISALNSSMLIFRELSPFSKKHASLVGSKNDFALGSEVVEKTPEN